MVIFDTNAILRYILQDNQAMAESVEEQLSSEVCLIPVEVVAEIVYVLSKVYSVERKIIAKVIMNISDIDTITIAQMDVVRYALKIYSSSSLDIVDCMLIGYAKVKQYTVFSFDRKLQKYLKE